MSAEVMAAASRLMDKEVSPVLSLRKIGKRYAGVSVLADIDLELRRSEIQAVLGENGAGKSTLIKIITGVIEKDSGEIFAKGRPVEIGSPQNARKLGIAAVPQDVLLVPELSIGRNILLGIEGKAMLRRDALGGTEREMVTSALSLVGASFGPEVRTSSLTVPELRLAQIARALVQAGDVLVLDEPTAVLSEPDAEHLLERLQMLRDSGKTVVYITHRLTEVMRIADRATILRDGHRVGTLERSEFDRKTFVALMAKLRPAAAGKDATAPAIALSVRSSGKALTVSGLSCGSRFQDVSFSVAAGQIVGLAGVQGSGHGHILRTIAGVDGRSGGVVRIFGKSTRSGSVEDAFCEGLLLVPADRRGAGIVPGLSNQANIALGPRIEKACRPFGLRSLKREQAITKGYVDAMSVHPASVDMLTGNLSGGSQQKMVLARALSGGVRILLAEEPTQGIDVRSRADIHALLRRIAKEQGCAVVIESSEFDELIGLADVIHVMRLGQLVATLPNVGIEYQEILHHALP